VEWTTSWIYIASLAQEWKKLDFVAGIKIYLLVILIFNILSIDFKCKGFRSHTYHNVLKAFK
jgi:hypothetical protein